MFLVNGEGDAAVAICANLRNKKTWLALVDGSCLNAVAGHCVRGRIVVAIGVWIAEERW